MKLKSFMCFLASAMMVLGSAITVSAQDININETDPDKVFPAEQVETLVDEANQKEIALDTKVPMTRAGTGSYPTRKGVILVTDDAYKGVINTGHSAIVYSSSQVVEANVDGVEMGPNNWNKSKGQAYGVSVSGTSAAQDSAVANWCYRQLGKPYNWNFYRMDYRDKFYCSHLIRAGFLDNYNIDLNTGEFDAGGLKAIHPMELVNTSRTSLIYRKK